MGTQTPCWLPTRKGDDCQEPDVLVYVLGEPAGTTPTNDPSATSPDVVTPSTFPGIWGQGDEGGEPELADLKHSPEMTKAFFSATGQKAGFYNHEDEE